MRRVGAAMRNQPHLVACVNSTNPTYCLLSSVFCLLSSVFCPLTHPSPLFFIYFCNCTCVEERNTGALVNNVQSPYSAGFIRATLLPSVFCPLTHPSPLFFIYFYLKFQSSNLSLRRETQRYSQRTAEIVKKENNLHLFRLHIFFVCTLLLDTFHNVNCVGRYSSVLA